jgi:sulfur carrier protein ThiS
MTRRATEEILVKVAQTGGEVKEYCLNGGRSVADALEVAGFDVDEEYKLRVNGEPADMDTELSNGDIVTIATKIEGGR